MFYTYIVKSKIDGKYYIGSTVDIGKRIAEHNSGKTKSLKNRRPVELIYKEEFSTRSEAVKRELEIKSYKGGNAFKKLII